MNTSQKRHKAWGLLLFGMLVLGTQKIWAAQQEHATITVTPVANVLLAISPTTYAYGPLAVNSSSITASALTLSNTGQVNVTVSKQISNQSNPAGWTAAIATSTDTYVLSVTTATTRPAAGEFTANTQFGAVSTPSNLVGAQNIQPTITTPGGALPSVDLWFKLDMPTVVSNQTAREITVRFTGTAQ